MIPDLGPRVVAESIAGFQAPGYGSDAKRRPSAHRKVAVINMCLMGMPCSSTVENGMMISGGGV
jgi:hypothetical protein